MIWPYPRQAGLTTCSFFCSSRQRHTSSFSSLNFRIGFTSYSIHLASDIVFRHRLLHVAHNWQSSDPKCPVEYQRTHQLCQVHQSSQDRVCYQLLIGTAYWLLIGSTAAYWLCAANLYTYIRLSACKQAWHAVSRWYWTVYIPWLVASYDTHRSQNVSWILIRKTRENSNLYCCRCRESVSYLPVIRCSCSSTHGPKNIEEWHPWRMCVNIFRQ